MVSKGSLPDGWKWYRLQDVASQFLNGGTPSTENDEFWKGNIPWVTGADFENQQVNLSRRFITTEAVSKSATNIVPQGQLLVCTRTGVSKIAQASVDIAISQDITGVIVDESKHVPRFVYWQLNRLSDELARLTQGTSIKGLLRDDLEAFEIPLPQREEQAMIVSVLDCLESVIMSTRSVVDHIDRLKTTLLRDLMTRGLPGKHSRFKSDKQIGSLPVDWTIVPLQQIADVERGKFTHRPRNDPRFYGGDIPFVQTGDVAAAGDYLKSHSQTLNEKGLSVSRLFPAGTILFVIAGSVGEPTIASYDMAFPDSVVGITPKPGINPLFLLRVLQHSQERIIRTATESAQANISLELLRPLPVPLPERDERNAIAKLLRSVQERIEAEDQKLQQLSRLKSALSQGLLTGRIPVRRSSSTAQIN